MYGRLFTLASAADHNLVFAWGMEIIEVDDRAAVLYRRDPVSRRTAHSVHESARAALARFDNRPAPMELVWMDMPDHIGILWDLFDIKALN
ncbi:hypothetical protein [Actinophytocola sp.]|jgi:hypothetical protein|uniref:hypothetical protein n=1 Tax=Actinophytocola sp. TaxID=1872138 RepID=UPI002D45E5DF|nr:hypothetical protein [Actinophytocola sp.]HYQ69943.1 hypothetical protein [Actinophytocola sp.]